MIPRPRLVISPADAAKLEEIWKTHASIVLGMLRTFCSCPEDAQDALQELFLRIGKNPAVVESAKSPRAFLIVAARRIAIDLARKRAAEQTRIDSPEAVDALHPAQESIKNDPEVEAAISASVQKLPLEQRAVFIAKIIQGKTLAVIAAEQNITLNTAASRLRYSLDKIRSQLRPHYEAMKNQTKTPMKNTLSDSSEHLIKPLEPKRVPSVAFDCIFLPPSHDGVDDASGEEFEIAYCDPNSGGNAWENAGTPPAGELPLDSSENEAEPEIVIEDNAAEESDDGETLATEDSLETEASEVIPEIAVCPEIDFSEQPVGELLEEIFEGETSGEINSQDLDGEDWSQYSEGEVEIMNEIADGAGESEVVIDETEDSSFGENYEDLLTEYDDFLAENPDWITEISGGDMHAQVVTESEYTGLELADPGAAQAFDIWFYNNYIAPRGGSVQPSGDGVIDYNTGVVTFDQESTPFMLGSQNHRADGGEGILRTNGLSLEKSSDQNISASNILANNQSFGPGNYQFTTEEVFSDQENDAAMEASSGQALAEAAKEQSVSKEIPPSHFSSVVPIVSGSEETIDSLSNDRPMFAENTKVSFAAVELPTLVETQTASAPEESHMMDDIAFTDDDSFDPAPTAETNIVAPESNAPAKTDVAAAVGGAFAVGTATQAAPARGASVKKVMPA